MKRATAAPSSDVRDEFERGENKHLFTPSSDVRDEFERGENKKAKSKDLT
jgi:hypothetical protein